ncbi:MAG: ligase [Tetrasphaera sp.]|jgi:5-formyltetrahydrofolate cyclo-ligase|nr:ligase [Tetrasphaera sp.]
MPSAKQLLRAERRAARREIVAARDRAADGERLALHLDPLLDAMAIGPGEVVTAYDPLPSEPDVEAVCRRLTSRGARVLVPITLPTYDLDWADRADPARTPLGLDAHAACRLLLIPGLAADRTGARLGQAGGCYDRALPRADTRATVVLVLHPGELLDASIPVDPWDQPVHAVLSADGLTWLRPRP